MTDHEILIPHSFGASSAATLREGVADLEAEVTVADESEETRAGFETATIAFTTHLEDAWLERADRLEWVQATSAGYDHYDLDALEERGVVLTNASGVHAQPIGEQALGSMLAFERNLLRARDQQREGAWERYDDVGELGSKTVGIVGLGSIGGRVAELATALGATAIGTKRDPSSAPDAADEVYPPEELDAVLERSDYLVVACPLTEETRGLLDERAFEMLPEEAVLVNVARGGIVDEAALIDALEAGDLAGAALDVFEEEPLPEESPLWNMENVLVTPHVAGSTPFYYQRVAELFRESFPAFVAGELDGMRNRIV